MGILTLLAVRLLRRQAALARLKNDLAATVSHELKTPLSSMRVLVDTLLDSEKLDDSTVREYLQLIARENERLSRLIQNFLTFSRMERNKYTFHFVPLPARQIVDAAVEAVRERFAAPGCHFEVQVEGDLPEITGRSGCAGDRVDQPARQRLEIFRGHQAHRPARACRKWRTSLFRSRTTESESRLATPKESSSDFIKWTSVSRAKTAAAALD